MKEKFEKKYHDVESNHWWFKSRRKYLIDLIKKDSKDIKILDIGCSSGIFLKDLEEIGFNNNNLFGVDISEKAILNCKKNGLANTFVMDAQNITLNEKFDIIVASDCLEHLEDDKKALQNWESLLKNNGKIYVFVPAFMALWSYHDEINLHYRRYKRKELKYKIQNENLEIIKSSYWNFSLFLPVYFFRKITYLLNRDKSGEEDISIGNTLVNNFLYFLIILENKILKNFNFPFGISAFCIARKKK